MNTNEEVFACWAPDDSVWSPWVKPVVFASMTSLMEAGSVPAPPELPAVASADGSTALVVNLPGPSGVAAGLELARSGYRPVPLYNAVPSPLNSSFLTATGSAVDVRAIARALMAGAAQLQRAGLRPNSPPAFLLDWERRGAGVAPPPGWFDNRSVSFTTDFPSGALLQSHGIRRIVLVQPPDVSVQGDLSHTLLRWQEAGLSIERTHPGSYSAPVAIVVPKPTWFGFAWQRALAAIGFRNAASGGFGGWVPEPSSSSG